MKRLLLVLGMIGTLICLSPVPAQAQNSRQEQLLVLGIVEKKAIARNDVEGMKLLLREGVVNVNAKDENGTTLLMHAIRKDRYDVDTDYHIDPDMIRMLLAHGARVNVQNKDGSTPLMYALYHAGDDVVKMILDRGANVNVQDKYGETPLLYAINRHGDGDVVKMILDRGANVNVQNKYGSTPLMYAAEEGNADIVKMLLDRGANVNIPNKNGWTALDFATERLKHCREDVIDEKIILISSWILPDGRYYRAYSRELVKDYKAWKKEYKEIISLLKKASKTEAKEEQARVQKLIKTKMQNHREPRQPIPPGERTDR